MNVLMEYFYFSIVGAALLLSALGLWFTAIIPGIDRWSKRFFVSYFIVFMICCLTVICEEILLYFSAQTWTIKLIMTLESLFLSLPLPMLTVYLLHCGGESMRTSRLLRGVLGLWAVYVVLLAGVWFVEGFTYLTSDNQFYRGPLYPILLLPLIAILLLNVIATIRRRERLPRKTFLSFLVAELPMTAALMVQLFVDVFPLIDISFVLAGLSMYSFILSDQIEQEMELQREIANQRARIMVLQMRPHFIYNTLMSIYSLCSLDPPKARQVTMDFTNYLRKNFNAVASDSTIPFSAELEHTRAYLDVEQAQYEEMLLVDYDTPFTRFRLPPLTLQPIVENAVKHGMNPYSGPLHISIRTRYTDAGVKITVEDNGPGFDPADDSRPHTTLTNIRQRLEMMCGASMVICPREGGGTVEIITIPPESNSALK